MPLPTLPEIEAAAAVIRPHCPPTPQYAWPLLAARAGREVWVKHENHTPIGAFKLRGGLYYLHCLRAAGVACAGLVSATRGNHGQSLALAGRIFARPVTIVVPHGNSREKNAAMRALGARLIEAGNDFEDARQVADELARTEGLRFVSPFEPELVCGVATYGLEFFRHSPPLAAVYVGVGMGSGACGLIAARDALGLATDIVGVVAAGAPAYALSFSAGEIVCTPRAETLADGLACRTPAPAAVALLRAGAARLVQVSEAEITHAMRAYYTDTHNLAEGAGAAGLAGLLQERARYEGRPVGVVLSGGNVDAATFAAILSAA
ncbi:MAG: threonine dehydratase [Gammaproteobacteria bacterium]|nr:threonine dehydratase [Gammaproteobacteria bacterium]